MKTTFTITLLALALAPLMPGSIAAQTRASDSPAVDRELERLLIEPIDEGDLDFDDLLYLHQHPLELRSVDSDELARLPSIDIQSGISIVDVVRRLQPRDHRELATMIELSERQSLALRAFTTLVVDTTAGHLRGTARLRVERDLVARRGSVERLSRTLSHGSGGVDTIDVGPIYRGAPESLLLQLALSQGPIALAATIASDRGEPLLYRDTSGYAYTRTESAGDSVPSGEIRTRLASFASLSLAWERPTLTVVLGDFTAELGQGLALADGRRRFSRTAGASSAYVAARRLAPYRSSDETSFLRGIAIEALIERPLPFRIRTLAFASWRWLDATLDTQHLDDGGAVPVVASIRRDGYRRTSSEIRRSANALERIAGANVMLEQERWSIGISALRSDLRADNGPVTRPHSILSIDSRLSSRHLTLYGEIMVGDGPIAVVGGAIVRNRETTCAVAVRSIPTGASIPHGRSFPQPGNPVPERGIFTTVETSPAEALRLWLGVDLAYRPLPSASVPLPHSRSDSRLRIEWTPTRRLRIEGRLEHARAPQTTAIADTLGRWHSGLINVARARAGMVLSVEPSESIGIRLRIDHRRVARDGAEPALGLVGGVDLRVGLGGAIDLRAGFAIFTVDDAEAAMYMTEADLPGRNRSIQLSGAGRRFFAALRWEPTAAIRIAVSYGESEYMDRRSIGSGLDEIDGPRGASAALQIDWRFGSTAPLK